MRPDYISELQKQRIADGDETAFRELFDCCFDRVLQFLEGFVRNRNLAEDLAQDIFVKLWCNREIIPEIRSLNTYIYKMARNSALNAMRSRGRNVSLADAVDLCEPTLPDDMYYALEKQLLVEMAVESLPERPRQVFRMSRVDGLSNDEIADRLNISKKTVENQMNAALKCIRYILQNCNSLFL